MSIFKRVKNYAAGLNFCAAFWASLSSSRRLARGSFLFWSSCGLGFIMLDFIICVTNSLATQASCFVAYSKACHKFADWIRRRSFFRNFICPAEHLEEEFI